jgi:O-antigen ligase
VDKRLEETVVQDAGLWGRTAAWKDSLGMIRDFPLFGVGLGAWSELFSRYQSPPWSPDFYRAAHNDYVEFLAETGAIGFAFLGWFFYQGGRSLFRELKIVSPKARPVITAMFAALGVMSFHELFDFSLQIPANAFLFTLLFALALRMAISPRNSPFFSVPVFQPSASKGQRPEVGGQRSVSSFRSSVLPLAIGSFAVVLVVCAELCCRG